VSASLASAVALAACSAKETGSPLAGINAVSLGRGATRMRGETG
jgi:hypothetical protein